MEYGVTEYGVTEYGVTKYGVTEYGVTEYGVTKYGVTESRSTEFIYALPPSVLPWTNLHVLWLWKSTKTRYCYS